MILAATLKKASVDGDEVRYVDSYGGEHAFLAGALVVKTSDLPDPPPALMRVSLSWYQTPRTLEDQNVAEEHSPAAAGDDRKRIARGERVKVIKSKNSGVRNPPEWLEQHLGKAGVVLWLTPDGASVELDGKAVWFHYDELARLCRD
jgi:hypothetical protein